MNEEQEKDNFTENPKIIVDQGWKEQVEKEKEELRRQQEQDSSQGSPANSSEMPIPEASFLVLVSALSAQAMSALGLLVDQQTGKPSTDRAMAKHFIDLLGTLEEKTKGNLDAEESQILQESLHQLRMLYVATANQLEAGESTAGETKRTGPASPIIQLP